MPIVIIAEKGKAMDEKKRGFLDYGKADEDEPKKDDDSEGDDEKGEGASDKRIEYLAEQTGVDDPAALIKLVRACMRQG